MIGACICTIDIDSVVYLSFSGSDLLDFCSLAFYGYTEIHSIKGSFLSYLQKLDTLARYTSSAYLAYAAKTQLECS